MGHIVGGLLAEVSADEPSEEEISEVRERAYQEGNPLKAPMRQYPIKVALLSGTHPMHARSPTAPAISANATV